MTAMQPSHSPPHDQECVLRLENLAYAFRQRKGWRYQDHPVLKDISVTLRRGESLGVLGRNGAGKSTLLQLMAGILVPSAGSVEISPGMQARLLTLKTGLIPHLSGRDNAMLSAMLLGLKQADARQKLPAIQEFSGIGDAFDAKVSTYSSGMFVRLSFSIATALDPEIILVDEVLGVGDASFKAKASAVMKDRIQSDRSVVLVSHSLPSIKKLCNRCIWIEGGVVKAAGDTDEVVETYRQFMNHAESS